MASISPCVQICRIDAANELCVGCGRSRAEIAAWSSISDETARRLMATVAERTQFLNRSSSDDDAVSESSS